MFPEKWTIALLSLSIICGVIVVAIYLYSGTLLPTPSVAATSKERIWLYITSTPLYLIPIFTVLHLVVRRVRNSKNGGRDT